MCGRFAQAQTREEYLAYLADGADRDIAYDPEPIGRYNVAPGTKPLQPAGCLSPSGSMAVRFVSLMVGTSGRKKATKNSHTSFTGQMDSLYLWLRSAAHRLSAAMKPRDFSS